MARRTGKRSASPTDECQCAICKNNLSFGLPEHLLAQIKTGNVVIFAGAGTSTENKDHAADTFYDIIAHKVGLEDRTVPFDKLMSLFCGRRPHRADSGNQRTLQLFYIV